MPLLSPGNKLFHPALKDASLKEDAVLAFEAFYADISPQPHHLPLIAAAGVLFLEADDVSQLYLHNHASCPEELVFDYEVSLDRW